MIDYKEYNLILKAFAVEFGIPFDELEEEFPHWNYESYADLQYDLQQKREYLENNP